MTGVRILSQTEVWRSRSEGVRIKYLFCLKFPVKMGRHNSFSHVHSVCNESDGTACTF